MIYDWLTYSKGGLILNIVFLILLAALTVFTAVQHHRSTRENQYRYRNILLLGVSVFLGFLTLNHLWNLLVTDSPTSLVRAFLSGVNTFSLVALPIAFVVSVLVTISNIDLLRKEGKTWRNMLGTFLGLLLLVSTLAPTLLGEWLQRTTIVDVHNEGALAMYVEHAVEGFVFLLVVYLECILLGAVVHGYKAAKHVPAFDKDYILILGCMIRKDGTLTPLLRGRVDRAVEFANMQKEATGKDIIFVPSGGQGPDEVIAEAEAMRNYLLSIGIPDEQILVENQSKNTYENFGYSWKLIQEHTDKPDPQIAFSTTNYHVFRSGFYATKQGIKADGIGSKTKVYYWVNAYIREFVATLRSEWKTHLTIVAVMTLLVLLSVVLLYLSNNI